MPFASACDTHFVAVACFCAGLARECGRRQRQEGLGAPPPGTYAHTHARMPPASRSRAWLPKHPQQHPSVCQMHATSHGPACRPFT